MTSSCAAIIFPHQLFENNPALDKASFVFLVEAPRYFTDLSFHKKKLILHRASMKAYQTMLEKKKYSVIYISYHEYENLFIRLKKEKINELHYIDLVDIPFEKEFLKASKKITKNIVRHESPAFLSPVDWLKKTFKQKKNFMQSFYVKQRKRNKLFLTNT
ncbi:MAG: cryptochrome/photolyase family protein, partial [Candidatus Babeliales bacterium]